MATTASRPVVSFDQYLALRHPVVPPAPKELFEFQVWNLRDKGLDLQPQDVDCLYLLIPSKTQMFLVLPRRPDTLDLNGLMKLIEVNGVKGENHLDVQHLKDLVPPPACAHLLVDVEDGCKRLNTKPSVSTENIKAEGRIAYSTWCGLIHGISFPYVLQDHALDLVGSRDKSVLVPCLSLNEDQPKLYSYWYGFALPGWGAPSAGSALGI